MHRADVRVGADRLSDALRGPRLAWPSPADRVGNTSANPMILPPRTDHLIDLALEEDAGLGDVTSRSIFPARDRSRGYIAAGQELVVCGVAVAARVFERVDPRLRVTPVAR